MLGRKYGEKDFVQLMEILYQNFYKRLYLYALTFTDDEDEAKDIVSDIFSSIWQKWNEEGKSYEPTAAYLYTTTRNRCLDHVRHSKTKERYALMMAAGDIFESDDSVKEYEQRITELRNAIDNLPEPGQTILKYCYFKKFTYKETAETMDISITMVHKHMLKVFKTLREMLK